MIRTLDLRLAPIALGAWAGAWLALSAPVPLTGGVVLLTALAALIAARRRPARHSQGHRFALVMLLALGLAYGAACAAVATGTRGAALQQLSRESNTSLIVEIEGIARVDPVAVDGPEWAEARHRMIVELTRVCARQQCHASREVALVYGAAPDVRAGMRLSAAGRLAAALPGGEAVAQLTAKRIEVTAPPRGIGAVTDAIRSSFRDVSTQLSPQGAGLVPGISIGDRRAIPSDLDDAMKAASLTHLTAVSGAHIAVILGAVLALTIVLPRSASLACGAATLLAMFLLVGPLPSVKRAMVMGLVVLLARLRGRAPAGLPALSVAVIVVIGLWPHSARSYGFALSVTATAGLMLLTPVLTRVLACYVPRRLAAAIAVPVAAQLACAPILALMLAEFQSYGVLANIIATPAFVPALLFALPAALLSPLLPTAALALAKVSAFFTSWLATVATTIASAPRARLPLPEGARGAGLVLVACALVIVLVLALDRRHPPDRKPRTRRAVAFLAAMLLVIFAPRFWPRSAGPWDLWQCDVGQGSALLVRTGDDEAMLIDTGKPGAGIARCLADARITRLSHVFLSHPHADHVGGLPDVVSVADVATLVSGPASHPAVNVAATKTTARQAGLTLHDPIRDASPRSGTVGAATWQVIGPSAALLAEGDTEASANDLSLVVLIETAGIRALVLGDLEAAGQESLLATLKRTCPTPGCLAIDVVIVAHHGSASQSAELASYLAAPIALISVGENEYGHPSTHAIDLYDTHGDVYRTDRDGHLTLASTPEGIVLTKRATS